jgi:hypothetical protein
VPSPRGRVAADILFRLIIRSYGEKRINFNSGKN